ncbi:MAG: TolC family protein [Chloroflexi bacterium]|nr:TolC family protein [Chloroflexota bacterium]
MRERLRNRVRLKGSAGIGPGGMTPNALVCGALLPAILLTVSLLPGAAKGAPQQSTPPVQGVSPAPGSRPDTTHGVPGAIAQPPAEPVDGIVPTAMSLADALDYATSHSPQVRVAAAQRRLALAKLIPQRPVIRPNITANASQVVEGPPLNLPLPSGRRDVLPWQEHRLWVQAEQVLYHSGRSANEIRLAAQTRDADAAYEDAVSAVVHDVTTAYYQVLLAQSGASIAHAAIGEVQSSVDTVRLLIQAGQSVPLDLLTAQQALSAVQQDALSADSGRRVAEANLNRSMGRPLDTPISIVDISPAPPPITGLEAAVTTALASRPDIREREAEVESARAGLTLARGEGGPTVSADAAYAVQTPTALQNDQQWTLRAVVSIPLLQSAQQQSDVGQAAAGLEAAEAGLQAQRDGDSVQVLKAWEDVQTAAGAVAADRQSVAEEQEALRAAALRRQIGEVTESSVAQARLKLEQALSTQARDGYTLMIRHADLEYAMGSLAGRVRPDAIGPQSSGGVSR